MHSARGWFILMRNAEPLLFFSSARMRIPHCGFRIPHCGFRIPHADLASGGFL